MNRSMVVVIALAFVSLWVVKAHTCLEDTPERRDLHLAELLDFRPDQGIIRLHEQRVVIVSAAAMGLLRKELIDTLGLEAARRVAIRFGFADGYHEEARSCILRDSLPFLQPALHPTGWLHKEEDRPRPGSTVMTPS